MPTIEELRKINLEKLKKLEHAGLLAYPSKTRRNHSIDKALKDFEKLEKTKKSIVLAGRIMAQRCHGGAIFLDINDGSEKIQVLLKKEKLGEKGFKFFSDVFDIADFVEIKGILFTKLKNY